MSEVSASSLGPKSVGQGRRVTVVGAGFSGLASAFHLVRAGFRVEVIEAQDRAGGLISTHELPWGRAESAANGLLNSAVVEELFREIGLPLLPTKKEARKRFIFRGGRPRRWPLGLGGTLAIAFFVLRALFAKRSVAPRAGESVHDWGRRVMGSEASSYTVETALQGIYAGDAKRMSARVIFGRFFGLEEPRGSSPRRGKPAIRGTVSAPEGMGQLIQHMRRYLESRGVVFRFGQEFSFDRPETSTSAQADGSRPRVDHPVVIAASSAGAARILAGIDPEKARLLEEIELLPVVTSTVFFKEPAANAQGFGCLFPPSEGKPMLGVLMNGFIFEGRAREGFSENWIMGGALSPQRTPRLLEWSDQEILNVIGRERETCFATRSQVLGSRITRWERALPHYTTDLEKSLPVLVEPRQNAWLIGNYLGQIGLAKILERAESLPRELAEKGSWK